jgi:hypothetical protein
MNHRSTVILRIAGPALLVIVALYVRTLPGFMSFANANVLGVAILSIAATLAFAMAFAPLLGARRMLIGLAIVSCLAWALLFGSMFATCDKNMRIFIPELILVLFSASLLLQPVLGLCFVALSLAAAGLLKLWEQRRGTQLAVGQILGICVGLALVAPVATFAVMSAFGSHPVAGNCVI